jgi:hypothetical protein
MYFICLLNISITVVDKQMKYINITVVNKQMKCINITVVDKQMKYKTLLLLINR